MKAIKFLILLLFTSAYSYAQEEQDSCVHLHEVVVTGLTGSTHINHIPSPVSVISANELQKITSTNVIDAIAKHPGISQITTGGGISKPVIRGLGYNRVLVVNDGIRQEGQQWGDEHGIEIDGSAVHSVEVMKGPATLMYGSDAMAGVVIMHDAPIQVLGTMAGSVEGGWQSNANLWNYSVNFAGNQQGFVWDWRWSQKHAGEYENAINHQVRNSQFSEQSITGMLGFNKNWGFSHLKLSWYHLKPGIIEGNEENDDEHEEEEEPESPFQQIHHYKIALDNMFRLGEGQLKALVGYQQNRRQEFEEPEECGLDFKLHSLNYDIRYVSPVWSGWTMNFGANGMWQQSQNLGTEFLIPSYNLFDVGVFATASKDFMEKVHLSGGVRFDTRHLHSNALEDDGEMRFEQFSRTFNGITGSVGAIYNITPEFDLRVNIARGFRAPNLSELGSNGEHEGTLRYEIGNKNLDPEGSWQFDFGIDYAGEIFSTKVSLFANRIYNYIFMEKTGAMVEGKDVFNYRQGDARLLGFEGTIILHPISRMHFENSFSYVDARQLNQPDDAKYLPFTPAPRWLSMLHYDINSRSKAVRNMFAEVEMECNLEQDHVHTAYNTETRTPAYVLWNASAGTDIMLKGKRLMKLTLSAQNIFNRAYQNHLNRLKEGGFYNMGRNVGIKAIIPLSL